MFDHSDLIFLRYNDKFTIILTILFIIYKRNFIFLSNIIKPKHGLLGK